MQAVPHQDPQESTVERQQLTELIAAAVDEHLDPLERWVWNALRHERLSLRRVARQLGRSKSTIHRIDHAARQKLAAALEDAPMVRAALAGTENA